MKKNFHFNKITLFILFISFFLIANVFLLNVDYIAAQGTTIIPATNPPGSPYENVIVFLEQPEAGSEILGQTNIRVNITNIDETLFGEGFTNFVVEVYKNSTMTDKVGDMYITTPFQQEVYEGELPGSRWIFGVDTLDFENGDYFLHFRAFGDFDENSEVVLYNRFGEKNLFGPITINNQAQIFSIGTLALDEAYQIFGKDVILSSTLLANDALQAIYSIKNTYGDPNIEPVIINVNDSTYSTETFSKWDTYWDSTSVPNGQYSLAVSFIALSGNAAFVGDERAFIIFNDNESDEIFIEVCLDPEYDCPAWPECPSSGIRERECVTINCVPQQTKSFFESCSLEDSSTNTNTFSTNTTTDTDEDTSIPPPPTTPPTINMRYPSQGDTVSGAVILKARVDGNIDQLGFVYRTRDGGVENHIGQATVSTTNDEIWQRPWNTDDVPSGEYYVFARGVVGNIYNYQSNFTSITIDHSADNTIIPDPQEDVPDDFVNDDGDVFSNTDENLLNLNPNIPNIINTSEDVDEIIDEQVAAGEINEEQAEILKEKYSKIVFDQPTMSGKINTDKLRVSKVDNVSPKIGTNNLVFSGIGPPNSYVTIYIYSDPIVVTTKTDENGNFTYTLDKNLLDGEHEVYVTVTDDTGKIQEKSTPLTFFVSRAQAVTEEEYLRGDVNIDTERSEVVNNFVLPALIMVGVLILVVGGVFVANRKKPV